MTDELKEAFEELKPCPFCGGEAKLVVQFGDEFQVLCQNCEAQTNFHDKEGAIAAWNRRVCCEKKPETLDTNSVAVKKLDTSTPCVSQNGKELDTNGSCTKKSYTCEEIETMRKKLEYYEADAGGASVADLLAENRRLREGLPPLFDSTPKPTYEELEEMVKPLKWEGDVATLSEVVFRVVREGQSDIFSAQIEIEDNEFTLECGLAEEDVKHVLQEWLVDLVAAALGVERSGR